ncbi:MAG: ISAzo13 family transposase [Egibacteraceae bacterium]
MAVEDVVAGKFAAIAPHLDERGGGCGWPWKARALGRGGVSAVARATGTSRTTVSQAVRKLSDPGAQVGSGRVRRAGAGRPRLTERDPGLVAALEALVDPDTRGDPQSPLRWTCKSTRTLADTLSEAGHAVSSWTVTKLLHELGYSLQANVKVREGASHSDRDAQLGYLGAQVQAQLDEGGPVVSVDTKKKELSGTIRTADGTGSPRASRSRSTCTTSPVRRAKRFPTGVRRGRRHRLGSVGRDHDTAAFAVATLRCWWEAMGAAAYPTARRLRDRPDH